MLAAVCVFALTACKNDDPKEPDMPGFGMTPPPFIPSPSLPLPDPDPIPDPAPEPEEARRQTLEYFQAQLDQDNIGQPPSFLYGQIFTPDTAEAEGAAISCSSICTAAGELLWPKARGTAIRIRSHGRQK